MRPGTSGGSERRGCTRTRRRGVIVIVIFVAVVLPRLLALLLACSGARDSGPSARRCRVGRGALGGSIDGRRDGHNVGTAAAAGRACLRSGRSGVGFGRGWMLFRTTTTTTAIIIIIIDIATIGPTSGPAHDDAHVAAPTPTRHGRDARRAAVAAACRVRPSLPLVHAAHRDPLCPL